MTRHSSKNTAKVGPGQFSLARGCGFLEPRLGTPASLPHALPEPNLIPALDSPSNEGQWHGEGGRSWRSWEGGWLPERLPGPCLPWWLAGGDSCRVVGVCGQMGERPGSPHRTLVGRVHGRVFGAMESPTKLLELGHTAQNPGMGRETTKCGSQHTPAVPSHPHMLPPRHKEGVRPGRQVGIPVVLRCVLVGQHLQVDGLRPPLDAPVLGPGWGSRGGE